MRLTKSIDDQTLRRLALALFVVSLALEVGYLVSSRGLTGRPGLAASMDVDVNEVFAGVIPAALGLVLTWARPRNPIGWLLALTGLLAVSSNFGQAYGPRAVVVPSEHLPFGVVTTWLSAALWVPALFIPISLVLVHYPSGWVAGKWPRRFERAVVIGLVLVYLAYTASPNPITDELTDTAPVVHVPDLVIAVVAVPGLALALGGTLLIVGDAVRRAIRTRAERVALVWLLTTGVIAVVLVMTSDSVHWIGSVAFFAFYAGIVFGVLHYKALGIDVVVQRTLLYVVLTGLVFVVFVAVSAGLAGLVPSGPTPQIVAAVLIALGITPARDRLRALVDRVLYGERADPWAAMRRLGLPMGETPAEGLLTSVVQALAASLHVQGVELRGEDETPAAAYGEIGETATEVPLQFAGEPLGTVRVAPRTGERSLGKADLRLLEAVAPLLASLMHADRLADQLRRERARVVDATTAERRRLRQELHDGLGPSLTGIGLGLEAAASSPLAGDQRTTELVGRMRTEVAASLEEIRRIIEDLRPGVLDDHDLLGALRQRSEQMSSATGVQVRLQAPARLPELTPAVQAAAYRIADEALANVVRHAHARHCTLLVSVDDRFHLSVTDDGVGINGAAATTRNGGVGLTSMRERAERLGGSLRLRDLGPGTEVVAELPL